MSAVGQSVARRVTLGDLADRYGWEVSPGFAAAVTVTAVADDVGSVRPGTLLVTHGAVSSSLLDKAQERGAYAVLVSSAAAEELADLGMPLVVADPTPSQLGMLAGDIAGSPSAALAVFAVAGSDRDEIAASVVRLSDFLHMLGNPVGVIDASGAVSLERSLEGVCPLGVLDVQHTLSVCVEDGATAVVVALDDATLRADALRGVHVDVIGADAADVARMADGACVAAEGEEAVTWLGQLRERYGFTMERHAGLTVGTRESDDLARQADPEQGYGSHRRLSLAIAMSMAAGVRKTNIRSALRVSGELR